MTFHFSRLGQRLSHHHHIVENMRPIYLVFAGIGRFTARVVERELGIQGAICPSSAKTEECRCKNHHFGSFWFKLAPTRMSQAAAAQKSFTVRVESSDYERLVKLADTHRPKLSKNYLVQVAIQRLLEASESNQLELALPQISRH